MRRRLYRYFPSRTRMSRNIARCFDFRATGQKVGVGLYQKKPSWWVFYPQHYVPIYNLQRDENILMENCGLDADSSRYFHPKSVWSCSPRIPKPNYVLLSMKNQKWHSIVKQWNNNLDKSFTCVIDVISCSPRVKDCFALPAMRIPLRCGVD